MDKIMRACVLVLMVMLFGANNSAYAIKAPIMSPDSYFSDTVLFSYRVIHKKPLPSTSFFKNDKYVEPKSAHLKTQLKKILNDPHRFDMDTSISKVNTEKEYDFSLYTLTDIGRISLSGQEFYYLFYNDFNDHRSEAITFVSLYQLDSKTDKLTHIPLGFQAATAPLCFGDFNEDGLLDYAEWAYGTKLTMYQIIENRLVKDPNHWIATEMLNFEEYFIVPDKTVWFKPF